MLKFIIDFLPIVLFFVVYKSHGIYPAIYSMIAATAVQIFYTKISTGKYEKSHLITFALLVVFGGITLAFNDPAFIMWKVSVLYIIFALVLIGSVFIGEKTLLQRILGKEINVPHNTWKNVTWLWGVGFLVIAGINAVYVNSALMARSNFLRAENISGEIELQEVNCSISPFSDACFIAQQTEDAWVNFKLFGTLGLTFLLLIITVLMISKYIKPKNNE
jgi:intracellular septation protein